MQIGFIPKFELLRDSVNKSSLKDLSNLYERMRQVLFAWRNDKPIDLDSLKEMETYAFKAGGSCDSEDDVMLYLDIAHIATDILSSQASQTSPIIPGRLHSNNIVKFLIKEKMRNCVT